MTDVTDVTDVAGVAGVTDVGRLTDVDGVTDVGRLTDVDGVTDVGRLTDVDGLAELADLGHPPKCRAGRPRSEAVDAAIESAVLELLVDEGYAGVTMEGVATRAGVGKASLYRRWPTKEQLVIAAVMHRCEDHQPAPDTGSLRDDVIAYCGQVLVKLRRHGAILRAVNAETARHPALAESFRAAFLEQRRAEVREVLARAVDRGELRPGADLELLGDLGPALLWHRLTVTGAPLGDDLPERIAALIAPAHR